VFGPFKKKEPPRQFPPVPKWRPTFASPIARVIERVSYYTDRKKDFAVFKHGTCAILPLGLTDIAANAEAKGILHKIFHFHADMKPRHMDDGNIAIQYNHPALNVVISDFAKGHWAEIESSHQDGLATGEVLITPLGHNKFDDFGKMALYGRCFMFMDAQDPRVIQLVRAPVQGGPQGETLQRKALLLDRS
jgi:hypothetical protein